MDEKILKAITDIRGKNHHRPCKQTLIEYFLKEGFDCNKEEIEVSLNRLVENGLIENRGAIGKDSFFIIEEPKRQSSKVNNSQRTEDENESEDNSEKNEEITNKTRYTLYSDFLSLRAKVEILVKAHEGSQAAKGTSEQDLKEEIALLKKENESLRIELRRKDLLINSIEIGNPYFNNLGQTQSFHGNQSSSNVFVLPNKRHSKRSQMQKPSWEPIENHANRFELLAHPDIEETYASVSRSKQSFENSRKSTDRKNCSLDRRAEKIINKGHVRAVQAEQRQENTDTQSMKTEIIGDSIIKDIKGYKMKEAAGHQQQIFVKSFSGATIDCMNSHACPTIKRNPKRIILHCGTNDVRGQTPAENIATEVIELAKSLQNRSNAVFVSGLVVRGDRWNTKVCDINCILKRRCQEENLKFIDNSNINSNHLNRSLIHLNPEGTRVLANNFLRALGYF